MTKLFEDSEYKNYKEGFISLCDKFDVHYTEDMVQEAFEDGAEPYDYLYEMYGSELEEGGEDD